MTGAFGATLPHARVHFARVTHAEIGFCLSARQGEKKKNLRHASQIQLFQQPHFGDYSSALASAQVRQAETRNAPRAAANAATAAVAAADGSGTN